MKRTIQWFLAVTTLLLGLGCAHKAPPPTPAKKEEPLLEPVTEIKLRLEEGEKVSHLPPLPSGASVYIFRLKDQELLSKQVAFRRWDMDQDGYFDMVEVLDEKGGVKSIVYDFNGDGQIDFRSNPQAKNL